MKNHIEKIEGANSQHQTKHPVAATDDNRLLFVSHLNAFVCVCVSAAINALDHRTFIRETRAYTEALTMQALYFFSSLFSHTIRISTKNTTIVRST